MPELPEVEITCRGIRPHIQGQKIKQVKVHQASLRWPVPVDSMQLLVGQTLKTVSRRAKYILLECEQHQVLMHLGMSGSLRIVDSQAPLKKHDHIEIIFENNHTLRLHDPRRFGCCLVYDQGLTEDDVKLLSKLGPEPLTDAFSGNYLYQRSRNKKQVVKTFIMDNAIVVGVGNIYASESLFKAGIHPKRAAGNISLARYEKLAEEIKQTLLDSIEQGGSTLKDFVNSDGQPGYFQQSLFVYGRAGKECLKCATVIDSVKLGQRSTFYCKSCQK